MNIKAVIFDIGQTLIYYNNPLNWQSLYSPAIKQVLSALSHDYTSEADENATKILTKYNTRVNYREHEVTSDTIFSEILSNWQVNINDENLQRTKEAFYGYFQRSTVCFEDTEYVLQSLKRKGIKIGALTDVAYGMDNKYALKDITSIKKFIDICLTSNDVGYRKPNTTGFLLLQEALNVPSSQIACVGDEEKDVIGANNAGMISVLVNRSGEAKNFLQNYTVRSLDLS